MPSDHLRSLLLGPTLPDHLFERFKRRLIHFCGSVHKAAQNCLDTTIVQYLDHISQHAPHQTAACDRSTVGIGMTVLDALDICLPEQSLQSRLYGAEARYARFGKFGANLFGIQTRMTPKYLQNLQLQMSQIFGKNV